MAIGVRLLVHGLQEQGKRHDFGSEGHTYDTEEGARACQRACSATRPHTSWGLASTGPYADGVQVTAAAGRGLLASRR
jgi:hypothetical protein